MQGHQGSQQPTNSAVNKSVNCTARDTVALCKITGLEMVSYSRNLINTTILKCLLIFIIILCNSLVIYFSKEMFVTFIKEVFYTHLRQL